MYYPIFVELSGRRVLVVGGGTVAARKIEGLLEAGALVTVVSPEAEPQIVQSSATLGADPDGTAESSVVSAPGTLGANAIVASIRVLQFNSDSVATVTGSTVGESITATIIDRKSTRLNSSH